jgi:hypothetical protein
VLYIRCALSTEKYGNFTNCYQNGPQKSYKEAKEGREDKESNHNLKEEGNCAEM